MSHENLDLAAVLHEHGYRITPQRQMVLDALCEANGHAAPEEIYELVSRKSKAVNRATVYRTLKFLQELDIAIATTLPDGHLEYEIAGPEPHHHLVCVVCGDDQEVSDSLFSRFVETIQKQYDFHVGTTHITLYGRCADCQ